MKDGRHFSMHQPFVTDDLSTVHFGHRLMTETDAQHGHFRPEVRDDFFGEPRFRRRAGTGGNYDTFRVQSFYLVDRDLIVPSDANVERRIDFPRPWDEVIGKRIVVIENEEHV